MRALRRRYGHSGTDSFRLAYLGAGARRVLIPGEYPLARVVAELRRLKRRGLTAWVEDSAGNFVLVRGATRQPGFNP